MKKFTLLFVAIVLLGITIKAQVSPGSLHSIVLNYDAVAHNHQVWTAQGYHIYDVTMSKDANGYITSFSTKTTGLMAENMDQYKGTGSKNGNVYTALSYKQNKKETTWHNWRNETWYSDGTKDTAIIFQDSANGGWVNSEKHIMNYNGNDFTGGVNYRWTNGAWVASSKDIVTYVNGKRSKYVKYTWTNNEWKPAGDSAQYFYSTKLDSIQNWIMDYQTSKLVLRSRYSIVCDANGKTTSFTQLQWSNSKNKWEGGAGMVFSTLTNSVNEVESNKVAVYPNPANNVLNLTNVKANSTISIFDLNGKMVISKQATSNSFDISELPVGIYSISIVDNEGSRTAKFVKQ